jgi:predicted MFS family arabinose efflux permease
MFRSVARTYKAAFSGVPRDIWLLSLVLMVNRAGSMVLPFISLYLTQERGLDVTTAGALLSLYGLGSAIGAWVGGWASDRIGAERTLVISLTGSGVLFLWLGFQQDFWAIAISVLLLSVVSESFRPACMTAVAQRAPAALRVRAFALLRLAANLGMGVGPAVGGVLALIDYRLLFVVDAGTSWAAALLMLRLPGRIAEVPEEGGGTSAPDLPPWRDGPFLALLVLVTLLAVSFFQVFSTLPLYFREVYGFREDKIGLLLGFNAAIIVVFEMVLVHWAERRDRMTVVGIGALLVCLGFGLMPLGTTLAFAALTIVVWTVGEMLALPLLNVVVAERAGPGNQGRYMGLYTMAFSVAFIIAPAAGTWTYARFGPSILWVAIGGLGLPLLVASLALRRALRSSEAASRGARLGS